MNLSHLANRVEKYFSNVGVVSVMLLAAGAYLLVVHGQKVALISLYGQKGTAEVFSVQHHSVKKCPGGKSIVCDLTGKGKITQRTHRYVLKINGHMLYANLRDGISIGSEVSIVFVPHDTDVVYVPGYEEKNMYIWLFIGILISIIGGLLLRHVHKNA